MQVKPQLDFLLDEDGTMLIDKIGRFETLAQDAASIFTRIGLAGTPLPWVTASDRHPDYRTYYTVQTRDRVAQLYARDIAYFGYCF
ncbi:MAG: hypothetical protein KDK89_05250 [Alphaproteobacteria bacterium]|nr:hypothetical protein [Alphaproteobacteria bacterium]